MEQPPALVGRGLWRRGCSCCWWIRRPGASTGVTGRSKRRDVLHPKLSESGLPCGSGRAVENVVSVIEVDVRRSRARVGDHVTRLGLVANPELGRRLEGAVEAARNGHV